MTPALVINPGDDEAFAALARSLAPLAGGDPAALAAALRVAYPAVVVNSRLISGESHPTWYVYRDGRWVPTTGAPPA